MAATQTYKERKEHFLKRLKKLYPDYTLISEFVDGDTFITLQHKDGYIWKTKPRYLDGIRQCKEISIKNRIRPKMRLTHEDFVERFFNKYSRNDFEILSKFQTTKTPMKFKHLKCGTEFIAVPDAILANKKGCPYCYGKTFKDKEFYQNKLNQKGLKDYEVLSVKSKDGHVYGTIKHHCTLCNNSIFNIRISDMVSVHSQECPHCRNIRNESKACILIEDYLNDNNIKFEKEKRFNDCKNISTLPFDFYLPDYNIIIEYDGIQHFKPIEFFGGQKDFERRKNNDNIKNKYCEDNNIKLIRISYLQKDIIKALNKVFNI